MTDKLGNNTKVSSGQTIRGRVENDPDGSVWVIQMKDLSSDYSSLISVPHLVKEEQISQKQLLRKGDILFSAKGNNNKAYLFNEDHPAVAISLFFVLRTDESRLDPGYLTWYLNSRDGQNYFDRMRGGTYIGNIKKGTLEEMEIPIPSIEKQKKVAKLNELAMKENHLLLALAENRKQLVETTITQNL